MNNHAQYWVNRLDPVMIHIHGDFGIRYYGVAYLLAFVFGYLVLRWYQRTGKSPLAPHQLGTVMTALILGVLLGGRLGYMILYAWPEFIREPWMAFRIWDGGMSSHGGFVGVALALGWLAFKLELPFFRLSDVLCAIAPIGLFLGRIANFVNGELWGKPADVPWAVIVDGEARHPSQLYEAGLEGLALFAILWAFSSRQRPRYAVSGLFLLGYGIFRFGVEFVRLPDAHIGYLALGWVTMGQVLTLPMILGGLLLLWLAYRRGPVPVGQGA